MKVSFLERAAHFLTKQRRHSYWLATVACLALAVMTGTVYSLIRQGQASVYMEKTLACPVTVHVHGADCYDESGQLICGYADYVVHTHNDDCYDAGGQLVCQLGEAEEHVHDASCWEVRQELACGLEENPGHQHSEACYAPGTGCTLPEHVHTDACYTVEWVPAEPQAMPAGDIPADALPAEDGTFEAPQSQEPQMVEVRTLTCTLAEHTHSESCQGEPVLICDMEVGAGSHLHGPECYRETQVLACGKNELHTHTDACYENGMLVCGKLELRSHVHDENCFHVHKLDEDEVADLTPGGDAGASDTPDVPETPDTPDTPAEGHRHTDTCYSPAALTCNQEEHAHTESCYTAETREVPVILEDGTVTTELQEVTVLTCTKTEHTHTDACYAGERTLICGLEETLPSTPEDPSQTPETPEVPETPDTPDTPDVPADPNAPHHHTDACYAPMDPICGKMEHTHGGDCISGEILELICGKTEHTHTDACYPGPRTLICGLEEGQIPGEEKPEAGPVEMGTYFESWTDSHDVKAVVTCTEASEIPEDAKLHVRRVKDGENLPEQTRQVQEITDGMGLNNVKVEFYDIGFTWNGEEIEPKVPVSVELQWFGDADGEKGRSALIHFGEAGPEVLEHQEAEGTVKFETSGFSIFAFLQKQLLTASGAPFALVREGAPEPVEGTLTVTLQYGDQENHPDGASYYTHSTMSGFIKLEPCGVTEDLKNVTVTLTIPKKYVEKDTVKIPQFDTNSSATKYEILPVGEDEENYYAKINFSTYDKTQTLNLPFALSFKDDIVPDNYELPVKADVTYGEDSGKDPTTSNTIIYKPLYKEWGIKKFVNSNKLDAFAEDGAEVVVTSKDPDGNPYLSDTEYVEFYFRVNSVTDTNAPLKDYRDATSVTLTDTLPSYEKRDGTTAIAVFNPAVNDGWTLSEDEKTVSKTYTGKNSEEVLRKIYNDEPLKLQFPDIKFEKDPKDDKNLIAQSDNTVDLLAIPSNEAEGETRPTATDPLHFIITTDPGTDGRFSKAAEKGNIYDTASYKTNPYPWGISVSNAGVKPLEHITIQDRKIPKAQGEDGLGGLDERLKFVKLESDWRNSKPAAPATITAAVEKVIAYYTDGSTQEFLINVDASGDFTVEFDKSKVCNGYEIKFKDDFKLNLNEAVSFKAYTVYRNPNATFVPEGVDKVRFENSARAVNIYNDNEGHPVYDYLTVTHGYDMLPVTEKLEIGKQTYANSGTENNMAGDKYRYWISLGGYLSEEKEYGKIYIVDLLPNEVDFTKVTHGPELFTGGGSRYPGVSTGLSAVPRQEENYHNSGRTALIWEVPLETLKLHLASKENGLYYAVFQIEVQIRPDAHPGTITNNIYIVGDNLEEYSGETGGTEDIYDLNNNGRTNDKIAYSHSDAVIIASSSVYAEKFIAPAGSDNWNKQGLSLKAGTDFDYLLKVTNELEDQTGLVVYDMLPAIGDKGVLENSTGRNSEFQVQLRGPISAPTGYTVYYTTSPKVYTGTMADMVAANIWTTSISDWSTVTAFKLVANEGVELTKDAPFQVRIPARVPQQITEESMKKLEDKEYQDQASGTMAYLEAINNFGFTTKQANSPKESNSVWVRIPFAGFTLKKVDRADSTALAGAEFLLTGDSGSIQTAVSDEEGLLSFRGLTEGVYTLTETNAPEGYYKNEGSLKVTITQDPVTMEYTVKFEEQEQDGSLMGTGTGSNSDPLLVENVHGFVMPETGSNGSMTYVALGALFLCGGGLLAAHRGRKRRA